MNRPGSLGGESLSGEPFVPPHEPHATAGSLLLALGDEDGDSLDPQRGIETLETMLFIESVYRQYFGDDPADASPGRPAELQVGGMSRPATPGRDG